MCTFKVKESIFRGFVRIGPSVLVKVWSFLWPKIRFLSFLQGTGTPTPNMPKQCLNLFPGGVTLTKIIRGCACRTSKIWLFYTNSGGLYRGDVSKSLGSQLKWSSLVSWAFWHLLKKNRLKNETVRAKTLFPTRGVCGGLEIYIFGQVPYFKP